MQFSVYFELFLFFHLISLSNARSLFYLMYKMTKNPFSKGFIHTTKIQQEIQQ